MAPRPTTPSLGDALGDVLGKVRGIVDATAKGAVDAAALANQQTQSANGEVVRLHQELGRYAKQVVGYVDMLARKDEDIRVLREELARERARDKENEAKCIAAEGTNQSVRQAIGTIGTLAMAWMQRGAEGQRLRVEVLEFFEGISIEAVTALRNENPERFAALVRRLGGRVEPSPTTTEQGEKPHVERERDGEAGPPEGRGPAAGADPG